MIASLEFSDARVDLLNDAATLVSENDRVLLPAEHFDDCWVHGHIAGDHVLIGVTHAAGDEANEHLVGFWFVELDFFDLVFGMRAVQDGCSCPHGNS
ncbi:unannotated protein [freshwater metagenome]|uniref:Unannotated protein n=1 Tax=freshwater metagenome TaxID=449393 RepID=A0A6J6XZN2_9ZZZZ